MSPNYINKGQLREWLEQAMTNKLPGSWLDGSRRNVMRLANSLCDSHCWLSGRTVGSLIGTAGDRWPSSSAKWLGKPSLPPWPQCGMIHMLSAPAVCLHSAAQTTYAHHCSFFFFLYLNPSACHFQTSLSSDPFLHITILHSTTPPTWFPAILVNYQCNLLDVSCAVLLNYWTLLQNVSLFSM